MLDLELSLIASQSTDSLKLYSQTKPLVMVTHCAQPSASIPQFVPHYFQASQRASHNSQTLHFQTTGAKPSEQHVSAVAIGAEQSAVKLLNPGHHLPEPSKKDLHTGSHSLQSDPTVASALCLILSKCLLVVCK